MSAGRERAEEARLGLRVGTGTRECWDNDGKTRNFARKVEIL